MRKKLIFSLIVVFCLSVGVTGFAYAAEKVYEHHLPAKVNQQLNFGMVIEIGANQFTIEKRDGGHYTYLVDEHTSIRTRKGEAPVFSDLSIGDRVIVNSRRIGEYLVAKVIGILPDNINHARWFDVRLRGEIVDIDANLETITVLRKSGEEVVVKVDDHTIFFGQAANLAELAIGWDTRIAARELEDGSSLAKVVVAREYQRRIRNVGQVTTIDDQAGSIQIVTRKGEEARIFVDEQTIFHTRDGKIGSILDIKLDAVVVLVTRSLGKGDYLATHIFISQRDDLPQFEVKKAGCFVRVEDDSFIIETRNGELITFYIDKDTNYRSRGIKFKNLEDLEPGIILLVGGYTGEMGENVAKLVIAIQNPSD